jgi:hypothetical protein
MATTSTVDPASLAVQLALMVRWEALLEVLYHQMRGVVLVVMVMVA